VNYIEPMECKFAIITLGNCYILKMGGACLLLDQTSKTIARALVDKFGSTLWKHGLNSDNFGMKNYAFCFCCSMCSALRWATTLIFHLHGAGRIIEVEHM